MDDFYSNENIARRRLNRLFYVAYKLDRVIGLGQEWHHKEFKSRNKAIAFAQDTKANVYCPSGALSWSYEYQE